MPVVGPSHLSGNLHHRIPERTSREVEFRARYESFRFVRAGLPRTLGRARSMTYTVSRRRGNWSHCLAEQRATTLEDHFIGSQQTF